MMKVRFMGESDPFALIHGKVYDVISVESGSYRIVDEAGDDDDEDIPGYLYPADAFEIVEE